MDVRLAVAVTMLPASRGRVATLFKALSHIEGLSIADVVEAIGLRHPGGQQAADEAYSAAGRALDTASRAGLHALTCHDPRYPPLLGCINDPPPVLWAKGRLEALSRRAIAVVGSRAATSYAMDVGFRLGHELADRGAVVVSGLARGVDASAHRGSLEAGGATIAVLGSGLDRIYPPEHDALAEAIAGSGVVVSELAPGAPPLPEHFPLRNRIISGISLAVVVVEASEQSGSLITARCALEQGRDVMAVPGSVLSGRNRGSHALLKDGAKVVETADDILEDLGQWMPQPAGRVSAKALSEDHLLAQMDPGESYGLDQLAERTGLAAPKLLTRLTELEIRGRIAVTGGRFRRLPDRDGDNV